MQSTKYDPDLNIKQERDPETQDAELHRLVSIVYMSTIYRSLGISSVWIRIHIKTKVGLFGNMHEVSSRNVLLKSIMFDIIQKSSIIILIFTLFSVLLFFFVLFCFVAHYSVNFLDFYYVCYFLCKFFLCFAFYLFVCYIFNDVFIILCFVSVPDIYCFAFLK